MQLWKFIGGLNSMMIKPTNSGRFLEKGKEIMITWWKQGRGRSEYGGVWMVGVGELGVVMKIISC